MQRFLTMDLQEVQQFEEQSQAFEKLKETQAALDRFSNFSHIADSKHLPSAQRLSSRRSLHKVNYPEGSSETQTIINAASSKLNSINRMINSRRESNQGIHRNKMTHGMVSHSRIHSGQTNASHQHHSSDYRNPTSDIAMITNNSFHDYPANTYRQEKIAKNFLDSQTSIRAMMATNQP